MGDDALRAAREQASGLDPIGAAERCGCGYEGSMSEGTFTVPFLGALVRLSFPAFEIVGGPPLPAHVTALLVYYLARSDGSEPTGRWRSFAELPDGTFYVQAFRGYTGNLLVRAFAEDVSRLDTALVSLGAEHLPGMADRAWLVPAFPRVPVALLWWDGDDEFEPRAEMLFDETLPRHLPTDGAAVLGSWLTAMLRRESER